MKMKRLVSLVIALLLVCGMPVSAFAMEDNPDGKTVDEISVGNTMNTNNGTVGLNFGTVTTNKGTVKINCGPDDDEANVGIVTTNNGIVITNNGTVEQNEGIVTTNNGTVGKKDESGNVDAQSGNYGTIETNGKTGEVLINQEDGVVEVNFGKIGTNESGGVVGIVYDDPEIGEPTIDSSSGNFGTITTNEGLVSQNGGVRFYSDPSSPSGYNSEKHTGCEIETNADSGLVVFNNEGNSIGKNEGTVIINKGTVDENSGEVKYNYGTVDENSGEVEYNYGTVVNEAGGTLYEYIGEDNNLLNIITEAGTYYGIIFEEGWVYEDDEYTTQWDGTLLLQRQQNDKIDLSELFKNDGYEVTGYFLKKYSFDYRTYVYNSQYISSTSYTVSTDSELSAVQLIWGKIKAAISPSAPTNESIPVWNADVPTAVAAEDVQVGTAVRAKGQIFKIIEMDDSSITVVTMVKLSEKDMEDLLAYLAKFLTPQQIELLLSEPELVSSELAAKYFDGNTNHIVFKAAKNLFAQ